MTPVDIGAIALDTKVVLYAFDGAAGRKHERARQILRRSSRFGARLPLQVAAETFRVLTGRFGWDKTSARETIAALLDDIPHAVTSADSTLAAMALCEAHALAFWDALIVTAAAGAGCGAVLTEDLQDGCRFDPPDIVRTMLVINPFDEENREVLEAIGVLG